MTSSYFPTVRYWLEVEALAYPELPKPRKKAPVKTYRYVDSLPWEAAPGRPVKQDHKYFVYFGLVDRAVLERELRQQYRPSVPDENFGGNQARPDSGRTFLFAVEVNADGHVAKDGLQMAAFAVSFAEKLSGKRIGHDETVATVKHIVENLLADNGGAPIDGTWLGKLVNFLLGHLAWKPSELMSREQVCVQRVSLVRSDGKPLRHPPELPPINSFYLDDLNRIATLAEQGRLSVQVDRFVNGEKHAPRRTDVTEPAAIDQLLQARAFPAGRWPSRFPLFMMQQVAVNGCIATVRDGGIFSVNGPPGTGKTTLLMDIIAAHVVERAKVMAGFSSPALAFKKEPPSIVYPASGNKAPFMGSSFSVDKRLLEFGIVVASANNNAVENITRDLPSVEKIEPAYAMHDDKPFSYFAATADAVLHQEPQNTGVDTRQDGEAEESGVADEAPPVRCWGLVSVPLGKKSNRNRVAFELGRQGTAGIAKALAELDDAEYGWAQACTRFTAALRRVEALQDEIARFEEKFATLDALRTRLQSAALKADDAQSAWEAAQRDVQDLADREAGLEAGRSGNMGERQLLAQEWGWMRRAVGALFRTGDYRAFVERRRDLEQEYDRLRTGLATVKRDLVSIKTNAGQLRVTYEAAKDALRGMKTALEALEAEHARSCAKLGKAVFDRDSFARLPTADQQKSLPRSNEEMHRARADVFISALHLHKAFMKNAGQGFETNFRLALSMLEQQSFLDPHLPTIAPHLWATFFLAVPVVSSTFASFSRCFKDLGQEQIGLLLIDEAGQAVPAHALGAIWRSKRTLIVGDPLQVEPVIKMEPKLDLAILSHHGAREEHRLTRYSAQHLADRGNRFGANVIQFDGENLWVGSPLRVHRRCVDPMFSLSNQIAYNEKMVFGPDPAEERRATDERPLLGESRWIDVDADDFVEHYSQAEGMAALDIVAHYKRAGWVAGKDDLPDLFLISPFKSVADGITDLLRDHSDEWTGANDEDTISEWLKGHVGTVHTFQGKECETVVFVLGGASGGARQWAAGRPNIINVAVTRAKRRLYVIGNHRAWQLTSFGSKLKQALPLAARPGVRPQQAVE
jgi:predicted  nucleic acid-binding Zn-ribbon protein